MVGDGVDIVGVAWTAVATLVGGGALVWEISDCAKLIPTQKDANTRKQMPPIKLPMRSGPRRFLFPGRICSGGIIFVFEKSWTNPIRVHAGLERSGEGEGGANVPVGFERVCGAYA